MSTKFDALRTAALTAIAALARALSERQCDLADAQSDYDRECEEQEDGDPEPEDPGVAADIEALDEALSQLEDVQSTLEELTWEAGE